MNKLAIKITDYIYKQGFIEYDEIDAYIYSFEIVLASAINVFLSICSAIYFEVLLESLVFLLTFASLRKNAGGFHFNNHWYCISVYTMLSFLTFYTIRNIRIASNLNLLIILLCNLYIIFVAPIENKNNPLVIGQIAYFKKKILVTAIIIVISAFFLREYTNF